MYASISNALRKVFQMPVSRPKIAVATLATMATVSGAVVAAPSAGAWTTSYNAESGTCTISFSEGEQQKLNTAWKTLFEAMAENTKNETLKDGFASAAENPVLDAATVTVTPEEAQANGGLYGIDVYKLVLPYGAAKAIENIGVEDVVDNIDWDAALQNVQFGNIVEAVDWAQAIGDPADVDVQAALKSLPINEVIKNLDTAEALKGFSPLALLRQGTQAYLANFLKQKDIEKLLGDALAKTDIDAQKTIADAINASGIDPETVAKNILKQDAVQAATKAELKKVPVKDVLADALTKAGKKPSIDLVLGYSPSEVLAAAKAAFKEVGPAVTAPILTARPAFTNCAAPQDGQAFTPASGSVVSGSSNLDLKGLVIVSVLGLVATLLASGAVGFALRPAYDQFIAQLH